MSTETDVPNRCDHIAAMNGQVIALVILVLTPPIILMMILYGLMGLGVVAIAYLIVFLTTPIHEKLHKLVFDRGDYQSEIRYNHLRPHVIAPNQHIDTDTWKRMELAPFVGLGIVFMLFIPPLPIFAGANSVETITFTYAVLSIHTAGSMSDLWIRNWLNWNYSNKATAYMVDTADQPDSGPFNLYYCPVEEDDI